MRRSKITYILDYIFLYPLIFISTLAITYLLWTRVHWLIAIILAFPIYRVIGYPIIDLTTPLYNLLTPENKAWSKYCKAVYKFDSETCLILEKALEEWDNGGNVMELKDCCKRIKHKKD